ncbi:Nucleotide-diphospho-sugar transferase [Arabidopsis thaliana x Arabidopsis arenosa]|uniref:glucomannan 4-beta-mannosyltransferase n=1 Tax=Arabidopsis thaliana x Arabidopsis arenosa TaxID=1240361 RepID=A0A8T1ZQR1_9BRAS|nr:Nucleotide-diphospho-sugar transferase [Arabidopsis thaliana x Arabidopsis arenosa]
MATLSDGLFNDMDVLGVIGYVLEQTRFIFLVPILKRLVNLCQVISVLLFIDAAYMAIVVAIVKLLGRTPQKVLKWESFKNDDIELAPSSNHPMVLIQIPIYNEKEVCQLSIGAACKLSWPLDRLIVQVLDDSTDKKSQELVRLECKKWESEGITIKSEVRGGRDGFKAGALTAGMKHSYVDEYKCEFVVIFDADFQPEPDFLERTIPFLVHNPEIALVQAGWKYGNADECCMTRIQEMSLNYHFAVEQKSGSSILGFFGFNGTAGVWRIKALNEAEGWKDRTIVEDMDLAVRAYLRGSKFVYVDDVKVKNELPSSFQAYRYQQHRWSCGPANLFKKIAMEIIKNQNVSLWKKVYLIYNFFFLRKIVVHMFTFVFYCVILPATVIFPEIEVPKWTTIYIPATITILNAIATPKSFYLILYWILFENVMAMHRTKGTLIGLLETSRVKEWVVTQKLGESNTLRENLIPPAHYSFPERLRWREIMVGMYLFICGYYDFVFGRTYLYVYLFLQSIAFFVVGVGYIGMSVPSKSVPSNH